MPHTFEERWSGSSGLAPMQRLHTPLLSNKKFPAIGVAINERGWLVEV